MNTPPRILVISRNEKESAQIKDFLQRLEGFDFQDRDFVAGLLHPGDGYDFAIFNGKSLPDLGNEAKENDLTPENKAFLKFFRDYLQQSSLRYILYYGERLHDLNRERCPAANSKFTLFARIRELMEFIRVYRSA